MERWIESTYGREYPADVLPLILEARALFCSLIREDEQKTQRQEMNKFLERMGPPLFDPGMANVKIGGKRRARGMRWIRWKLLDCWRDGGLQLCTPSHWVKCTSSYRVRADHYYLHKPALTDIQGGA
jgi:hypothetical protein